MSNLPRLDILLCAPRGFCAGVDRAIQIVELALERYGPPVYVRHEIVHNKYVVDDLRAKGAVFVEELAECPADRPVIFSAHGVPRAVPAEAARRARLSRKGLPSTRVEDSSSKRSFGTNATSPRATAAPARSD